MEPPSQWLLTLLRELRLAGPNDLRRAGRHCRRLACDLPTFDSVWIDALVRSGRLTLFQADELQAGRGSRLRLGNFVLVDRIAAGFESATYAARSLTDGRSVALKEFTVSPDRHAGLFESLNNLVNAAGQLGSRAVIAPVQVMRTDNRLAVISPLASGDDARRWLIRQGRLAPMVVADVARQLVLGLSEAHRLGLAHGDVGLSNIRLTLRGEATLVDFGIRSLLSPRLSIQEMRPPDWYAGMAPERIGCAAPATPASDIYSLGCALWHLLAGRPPFPIVDPLTLLAAHRSKRLPDVLDFAPETHRELARAIEEMTAIDPLDRPTDLGELLRRLKSAARSRRSIVSPSRSLGPTSGNRWTAAAVATLVIAGAAFALFQKDVAATVQASIAPAAPPTRAASDTIEQKPLLVPLPAPDPQGVVSLEPSALYVAGEITFPGPLTIRGIAERPATIVVVDQPLRVRAHELTVEHVQLVGETRRSTLGTSPLLVAESQHLTLESCRLEDVSRAASDESAMPAAVRWRLVDRADPSGGRFAISDSVVRGVRDAISFADPPRQIVMTNLLGIGCRSLVSVEVPHGKTIPITVQNVTLRECETVVQFEAASAGGAIDVSARDSIVDLTPGGALFTAATTGQLCRLSWRGSGVVTAGKVELLSAPGRASTAVDTAPIMAEGLTPATVEFAGQARGSDAGSVARLVGVPRRADRPPGIDLARLPRPASGRAGHESLR